MWDPDTMRDYLAVEWVVRGKNFIAGGQIYRFVGIIPILKLPLKFQYIGMIIVFSIEGESIKSDLRHICIIATDDRSRRNFV